MSVLKMTILCGLLTTASAVLSAPPADRPGVIEVRLEKQIADRSPKIWRSMPLNDPSGMMALLSSKPAGVPEGWRYSPLTDNFPQLLYQGFRAGRVDEATCMRYFNAWQQDTAKYCAAEARVCHMVALGRDADSVEYIMFDTDGDYDFTGEERYVFGKQPPRIKVLYDRIVGKKPVRDSTWLEIATQYWDGQHAAKVHEMTQGTFVLGGVEYACKAEPCGDYDQQNTVITISGPNTSVGYAPGNFARIAGEWYKIDSISSDGRFVRLVHTPDADERGALQVGFRPYAFTSVDLNGKTVRFPEDFAGKYVLLDFWALSCGPCVHDIREVYPDLYKRFHDFGFEIVGVADNTAAELRDFVAKNGIPWVNIADRDEAKVIKDPYRIISYPTLFLIGPDGRIILDSNILRGLHSLDAVLSSCLPQGAVGNVY